MMSRSQFEEARSKIDLPAIVGRSTKLVKAGRDWKCLCPFHADRSPSLAIWPAEDHWRYSCYSCGANGDGLDWLQKIGRVSLRDAVNGTGKYKMPAIAVSIEAVDRSAKVKSARRVFADASPARGTFAQRYLATRGIDLAMPDAVRFTQLKHPDTGKQHPVALFGIVDADGEIQGVQRVYLADDGSTKLAGVNSKLSLGRVSGGAIRFAPLAAQIAIAEGPETALSVQQLFGVATWAACGVTNLARIVLPQSVKSVVIAADVGDAGDHGARTAARTYAGQGRSVRIIRPLKGFGDFNDELRGSAQ